MGVSYEFIEDQLWGPRKAEQIVGNFFRFSSRSSRLPKLLKLEIMRAKQIFSANKGLTDGYFYKTIY